MAHTNRKKQNNKKKNTFRPIALSAAVEKQLAEKAKTGSQRTETRVSQVALPKHTYSTHTGCKRAQELFTLYYSNNCTVKEPFGPGLKDNTPTVKPGRWARPVIPAARQQMAMA